MPVVTTHRVQDELFDSDGFRAAVIAYIDRHHLNKFWLATISGLGPGSTYGFLSGRQSGTLLIVCALANVCDLSLDHYVRRGPVVE